MGFNCGIVGLPNVGKSTIFNALTAAGAAVANYPFCTIDPNIGIVVVPDPRLETLAEMLSPQKVTPTTIEFVDIAGLVQGASRGEGLGNKFLGHIREVDALIHIVRCFEDPDVIHVGGTVDPKRDIEIVRTELILADLDTVERRLEKTERLAKVGDKDARKASSMLERLRDTLDRGLPARLLPAEEDAPEQRTLRRDLHLLTDKKVLYVANVGEEMLKSGAPPPADVDAVAAREGAGVVTICGDLEAEIAELPPEERQAFLDDLGLAESGLQKLVRAGYDLLGLITFYTTVGPELRAWTISEGTTAPSAAGKIHTDMERGFIRAEILHFKDFITAGGIAPAREKGLLRSEGKGYVMADGDIALFRFNV